MNKAVGIVVGLALLGGCSGADDGGARDQVAEYAGELGTDGAASASATASAGGARSVAEANDVWNFEYAYPAQAGRIPELRALLDGRLQKAQDELKAQSIDGRATADEQGYPYRAYALNVEWKTVADLPNWLSLSSEFYSFQGGAHGNTGFDALVWDKQANVAREPLALFSSPEALAAAVKPAFCAALDRQREQRRGEPVDHSIDDWMNQCPEISEATLILGSSNSRTFDRIGFLIGPYVAGPYAEGTFEVTLPVTAAVKAAVAAPYSDSFTVTR